MMLWCKKLRGYIQADLIRNPQQIRGFDENGEPKIVEIDESLFCRRKNHVGRVRRQRWAFWRNRKRER